MKPKASKWALLGVLATSTVLVSAWAGGDPGDYAAGGDSVGTLPSTSGGNAVVVGEYSEDLDSQYGVQRRATSFFVNVSESGVNAVISSASGTRHRSPSSCPSG